MNLPVEGAFHNLVLVCIKKQYPFHASRIAHGLWGAGQMMFSKVICVVDDDVDVQNTAEVAWRAAREPRSEARHLDRRRARRSARSRRQPGALRRQDCIDGTRKWAEEGYTREWPEVCRFPPRPRRASTRCCASSASRDGAIDARQRRHGDAAANRRRDVLGKSPCADVTGSTSAVTKSR